MATPSKGLEPVEHIRAAMFWPRIKDKATREGGSNPFVPLPIGHGTRIATNKGRT